MADVAIPSSNSTFSIYQSNTRWIVSQGAMVDVASGNGITAASQYTGTEIVIAGSVHSANAYAIESYAIGTKISIAKGGNVSAGSEAIIMRGADAIVENNGTVSVGNGLGIRYLGANADITNNGTVKSDFICIGGTVGGARIENNGRLEGSAGIYVAGADNEIILGSKSRIIAEDMGIWAEGNATFSVVNHGFITGGIRADNGVANITNLGTLKGEIRLEGGEDIIDISKGKFDGTILGGAGDDLFILKTGKTLIVENAFEGTDTIQASSSISLVSNIFRSQELENVTLTGKAKANAIGNDLDNELNGNKSSNKLTGGDGIDTLAGNKGNDILKGGAGADFFVFHGGDRRDTILDLQEADTVRIEDWTGIDDFLDILSHAKNVGRNVVISSGNDALVINGLHKADLDQTNFDFL